MNIKRHFATGSKKLYFHTYLNCARGLAMNWKHHGTMIHLRERVQFIYEHWTWELLFLGTV